MFGFSNSLWAGLSLPLDLAVLGMPTCRAYCSVDITQALPSTTGTIQTTVLLPSTPATLGTPLYAQVLGFDPGINAFGAVVSNGLALVVGN